MGIVVPTSPRIIGGYTDLFYIKFFEYCLELVLAQEIIIFFIPLLITRNFSQLITPFFSFYVNLSSALVAPF